MNRRDFLHAASVVTAAASVHRQIAAQDAVPTAEQPVTSIDESTRLRGVPTADHPLCSYANPLQGTNSSFSFSRGGTLPIVALPFGMAHWALQTTAESSWFFNPHDRRTEGVRCTHQLSPWLRDYGYATFMPFTGSARSFQPGARGSSYRPEELQLSPHAMQVPLQRYGCTLAVTPTERGACLRVVFMKAGEAGLCIDLNTEDAEVSASADQRMAQLLTRVNFGGVPPGFATYYNVTSDVPFSLESFVDHGRRFALLRFQVSSGQAVTFRVGTSFIGADQARYNAETELGTKTFEQIREKAASVWEMALGRVRITGASLEENRTFYSCLYRTLLFPRMWHEPVPNASGVHHMSPYTGTVTLGVMYADHGYWDDYHAWYPMMTLLYPDRLSEILQAWINAYHEGGWFPQFPCPGYRAGMTGSLIDSVFGDAISKGITGFDLQAAYAGLKKHATEVGNPAKGYGRSGLELYLQLGYVPCDVIGDGLVETLDSAYGDFCIAQVAAAAGHPEDAAAFMNRSQNWRALFDPATKFLRGKLSNGSFVEPFDPIRWGDPYVEGSAWQYRFAALHDIPHLIELHGGRDAFVAALEAMLTTPPYFHVGSYGGEIHEMSEMAAANFGQYAHSNQPVHNFLYLFSVADRRDRTEHYVHRVLRELYTSQDFPGDEDTGAMAAWYVLGCLGLFSHCPGRPDYTLGAPMFPSALVTTPNAKIRIEARRRGGSFEPLAKVSINGRPVEGYSIPHTELRGEVLLVFSH